MAKVIKEVPGETSPFKHKGPKKIVVFGLDTKVVKQMTLQLQREKAIVVPIVDERKLLLQIADADPDIIFLEITAQTKKALEDIVADIFVWMRARVRAINKTLSSPSGRLWQRSRLVLYRLEVEIHPTGSVSGELADLDDLVFKCSQLGNVQYMGLYSPWSFVAKVRPLLEEQ